MFRREADINGKVVREEKRQANKGAGQLAMRERERGVDADDEGGRVLARDELNLLAKVMGTKTYISKNETFRLNMFNREESEDDEEGVENMAICKEFGMGLDSIEVEPGRGRGDLARILQEMTLEGEVEVEGADEDILALMDKAA